MPEPASLTTPLSPGAAASITGAGQAQQPKSGFLCLRQWPSGLAVDGIAVHIEVARTDDRAVRTQINDGGVWLI